MDITVTRNTTLNFGATHSPTSTNAEENLASAVRGICTLQPPQDTCQIHRNNKSVRLSGRQAAPPIIHSWDLPILERGWRKLKQRAEFTGGTDMAALKEQQANGNETQTHHTMERCCSFQPGPSYAVHTSPRTCWVVCHTWLALALPLRIGPMSSTFILY